MFAVLLEMQKVYLDGYFAGTGMNVVEVSLGTLSARRPPDSLGKELRARKGDLIATRPGPSNRRHPSLTPVLFQPQADPISPLTTTHTTALIKPLSQDSRTQQQSKMRCGMAVGLFCAPGATGEVDRK